MGVGFCVPSSEIATGAAAAAYAGSCYLIGALLISDGTNDPKAILYDHATAVDANAVLAELSFDVSVSGLFTQAFFPTKPIRCEKGIWTVPSGTGATVIVYYEERG